jgi:hypothetical protein
MMIVSCRVHSQVFRPLDRRHHSKLHLQVERNPPTTLESQIDIVILETQ